MSGAYDFYSCIVHEIILLPPEKVNHICILHFLVAALKIKQEANFMNTDLLILKMAHLKMNTKY